MIDNPISVDQDYSPNIFKKQYIRYNSVVYLSIHRPVPTNITMKSKGD